jgi:hypothetical protein
LSSCDHLPAAGVGAVLRPTKITNFWLLWKKYAISFSKVQVVSGLMIRTSG